MRHTRWISAMSGPFAVVAMAFLALVATWRASADDGFVPASRQASKVGVVSIHGVIDDMTLKTLERRLDAATRDGCNAVVLELDTPGGVVGPTLAICHLLKTRSPANKVAWVRPQAYSAGIITALACREIIVAAESSLGDAAPIGVLPGLGLQPLPAAERAKLESPILSEVTDSALRNGHDVRLARAFVRTSDELWLLERDDGRRMFANAEECRVLLGGVPSTAGPRFVPEAPPRTRDRESSAEMSDLEPASVMQLDAEDALLEQMVLEPRSGADEAGRWTLLGKVDTAEELVTLRGSEARRYGLAAAIVDDETELARFFGATTVIRYDEVWSEHLVRFLISWPVRGVLIVIMLMALFAELATPGVGVFGAVSFAAFLIVVGAPTLAGLADWWEILLIVIGVGLIIVELLAAPGLGVAGAAGAICLLVGLVFSFVGGDLSSPTSRADLLTAFLATIGSFAIAGVAIALLAKHLPSSSLVRALVLETAVSEAPAKIALGPARGAPELGAIGVAQTDLRPGGRVDFGDRAFDARSTGAWIPRGTRVRVVDQDGMSFIVEEVAA